MFTRNGTRPGIVAPPTKDSVADSGLVTLDDHDGHPSIRNLVDDDYEIITF